ESPDRRGAHGWRADSMDGSSGTKDAAPRDVDELGQPSLLAGRHAPRRRDQRREATRRVGLRVGARQSLAAHVEPGAESEAGVDAGRSPNRVLVEPGRSTESL